MSLADFLKSKAPQGPNKDDNNNKRQLVEEDQPVGPRKKHKNMLNAAQGGQNGGNIMDLNFDTMDQIDAFNKFVIPANQEAPIKNRKMSEGSFEISQVEPFDDVHADFHSK